MQNVIDRVMRAFGLMKSVTPEEYEETRDVLLDFLSQRLGTDEHRAAVEGNEIPPKFENLIHASLGENCGAVCA